MTTFHFNENSKFIHKTQGKCSCADYDHIWRTLDESQFIYVTQGDLFIEQGGQHYHLQKGDYLISEKNIAYGGYKPSTAVYHWVHFDFDNSVTFSNGDKKSDFSIPKSGHIEENNSFAVLLTIMHQYSLNIAKKRVMNGMLEVVLRDLWANVTTPKQPALIDERFQPVLDYFHQNPYYNEFNDLKSMAQFFGYSEKYMIRLFNRNTGQSPMQYLATKKIQRAQEMLADTDMTVKAIAATLHYDYYYFMRLFRKKTGMTPNQFRKRVTPDCTIFIKDEQNLKNGAEDDKK